MTSTLRRTWAEINLDNLAFNYKKIREYIGENVKFLGVVKADAYGHGSVQVASKLQSLGADYLAVSSIDEAMELRVNDVTMPILILGHTPKEQVDRLISYDITQAVTCEAKAIEYNEEALRLGKTLKIHIKVDTGMSRLGYICEGDYFQHGVDGIVDACKLPGLEPEGIFTHFAVSDEAGEEYVEYTKHQFKLFTDIIDAVEKKTGMKFKIRHCANTGATVDYPETYLDMVRPGLLL
jgi:alanine racemase